MNEPETIEVLKQAILLERKGRALYKNVAEQSKSPAVQDFFALMAEEEERHIEILSTQGQTFNETGALDLSAAGLDETSSIESNVLTDRIKGEISAADYEAAAIEAAIAMEEKAVEAYSDRTDAADDPEEKKLYEWLASWEQSHLHTLWDINKDLTEKIWFSNQFWPF